MLSLYRRNILSLIICLMSVNLYLLLKETIQLLLLPTWYTLGEHVLCQSPRTTSYPSCPQEGRQCLQFQVSNSCCLVFDSFPKSSSWAFSHHFCFEEARRRSLIRKAWRKDRRNKISSKVRYLVKNMKEKRTWERRIGMC